MVKKKSQATRDQALRLFEEKGGVLHTSEALKAGIHPRVFYELRDEGKIEKLATGLYGLPNLPGIDYPDFVIVSKKIPDGVICLISALYFHHLTIQIPRWVDVAVRKNYKPPPIQYPSLQFHWFSDAVFDEEIQEHQLGAISVKIYSPEKTIIDCFRLRHKVGIEVALEALKTYWRSGNANLEKLRIIAKKSKVFKIVEPYIQAVIYDQS